MSQACAGLTALAAEATRTGWIPSSTQDASEPEPEPEPMDWWLVAQNSTLHFARDTGGSTLQRAAEHLAQARAPPCAHAARAWCGEGARGRVGERR